MAVDLPAVTAPPGTALSLDDLRDLVRTADALGLPGAYIVRTKAIPFRMADLGNTRGSVAASIALDHPANL